MIDPNGRALVRLMRAVAMLAMPPAVQADYLTRIGTPELADELALDLDDGVRSVDSLRTKGYLTDSEYCLLHQLNRKLDAMSRHQHEPLWRTAALADQPEWQEIRAMAQEFLHEVA